MLDNLMKAINGRKVYIAALGLVGLAAFEFSQGRYEQALQTALAALAAFGLRHAQDKAANPTPQP